MLVKYMSSLRSLANGGWANPARHTGRTGVAVVAAGRRWLEDRDNGTAGSSRGPAHAAFDEVRAACKNTYLICEAWFSILAQAALDQVRAAFWWPQECR
jgi:hypothetical protein